MKKIVGYRALHKLYLLMLTAFLAPVNAQTPLGSIDVFVTDENGAVLIGATVTGENVTTGFARTCTTDDRGFCRLMSLPSGSYKVIVSATHFNTAEIPGVVVAIANETPLTVPLSTGSSTQMVNITASATTYVETQSTALVSTVSQRQLKELPLINNRNFLELAMLAPGVTSDPTVASSTVTSFGGFSANGARSRSNTFLLDGQDVGDSSSNTLAVNEPGNFGTPSAIIPSEAVKEFVVTTNFSAAYGRSAGSVVNIASRSGTNEFHGALFEYFRHRALSARNFLNTVGPKNKLRSNDFGFSLGGPFKKDKLTFFVAYEGSRDLKETTTLSNVPTDLDFAQAITAIGGNPLIPLAQNPAVNPVIRSLFALCRTSAQCPGGADLWPGPTLGRAGLVLNALGRAASSNRSDNLVARVDFRLNEQDSFSINYALGDSEQNSPLSLAGGEDLPNVNTLEPSRSNLASLSYAAVLASNKVNDLRVGWSRYAKRFLDADKPAIANPTQTLGLNTGVANVRDFGLPQLVVRGFASLGASPFSNPRGKTTTSWQVVENFNWSTGRHDFRIGYEFRSVGVESSYDVNFRGSLEFSSLADFLAGRLRSGSIQTGGSDRVTNRNFHSLYFHDTVRFGPKLSTNFGVRWDYFGVLSEKHLRLSKYDPSIGLIAQAPLYSRDLNNFAPRAGIAWDLTGRQETVFRAGAGLYFDAYPQDFFVGQIQFNSFNGGVAYNPIPNGPILTSRSPTATIQPGQLIFLPASFAADTKDAFSVANIRTPYLVNYNANFQRQLFSDTVLQIAYVGSLGRNLFRTRDINAPLVPGGVRPFDRAAILSPVAPSRPFIVNQIETSARSNYNSLQVSLNQTNWHRFSNSAQWTWSHSIDDASDGIDSVPNLTSPNNPQVPTRERANSNFDTRHRFVWSFIYNPQAVFDWLHAGKAAEGWEIAGIVAFSSGQPYQVNFGDEFDSKGAYDYILRPDVVGNPFFGTRAPDRLLNLTAFQVPCTLDGKGTDVSNCLPGTLHFGNLPRNAFVGSGFGNLDMAVAKSFDLGEKVRLQVKAEVFNLTNHPNFATPLAPRFIARVSLKGIDVNGRGGARGVACNTEAASTDCYLPSTRTSNGARSLQLSIRLTF